jgi:hypothetical protein
MPVDRTRVIIGVAIAALLAAVWWFSPVTPVAGVTADTAAARPRPAQSASDTSPVGPVKLDSLASAHEEPGSGARNPFRFKPKAPPPPPPRPLAPPPSSAAIEPARPAVPQGPPPPPPIPLKFIGVLERANGVRWAVLSDGKSASPIYGKDGDIIDGRYTIVKIGTESIEMTHADGRGRQVIRLNGQ